MVSMLRSGKRKRWALSDSQLVSDTPAQATPQPLFNVASLVNAAAQEWKKLKASTPPPDDTVLPAMRAQNFPLDPDTKTMTAFKAYGINDFLSRVQQEGSVAATVKQLAEFVAWCKRASSELAKYVCLVLFVIYDLLF